MWVEKRTGGYIGRYRVDGQTQSTTVFKRKKDATDTAREAERQGKLGKWIDPKAGRITVAVWSQKWLGSLDVSPSTRHNYEELLSSLILPRWGKTPLSRVTLSDVKRWVATMSGPRGPISDSRRRAAGAQLVRMLDAAVDEGLLHSNPARTPSGRVGYLPSPARRKAHRYLSHSELEALASASGDHGTMVRLAGLTGLRWGEVTALQVGDVDYLGRKVTVSRAYSIVGGKKILGGTKTHEHRTVALSRAMTDALARSAQGKDPKELLFATSAGEPLDHSNFARRVLDGAWRAAGIERLTFHDLRHTAASLAISSGASVKAVQGLLGHKSAAMTLDVYAGLFDTDAEALAERMDEARERAILEGAAHHVPTAAATVTTINGRQER